MKQITDEEYHRIEDECIDCDCLVIDTEDGAYCGHELRDNTPEKYCPNKYWTFEYGNRTAVAVVGAIKSEVIGAIQKWIEEHTFTLAYYPHRTVVQWGEKGNAPAIELGLKAFLKRLEG